MAPDISALLKTIQTDMFVRAKNTYDSRVLKLSDWHNVIPMLDNRNVLLVPWCEGSECENTFKKRSTRQALLDPRAPSMGAKSLCIPLRRVWRDGNASNVGQMREFGDSLDEAIRLVRRLQFKMFISYLFSYAGAVISWATYGENLKLGINLRLH